MAYPPLLSPPQPAAELPPRPVRTPIPVCRNALLIVLSFLISTLQLWIVPVWLLPLGNGWALVLGASLLMTPFQWALIHESLHALLLPGTEANVRTGRALCILFGVPFHLLRFGHLAHHRFNRCAADRPEVFDPATETRLKASLRHYSHLMGGMYLASAAGGVAAWLPAAWLRRLVRIRLDGSEPESVEIARMAEQQLVARRLSALRLDALLILVVAGATAAAYGRRWAWAAALILGRALLVSLLDNSYHYGTDLKSRGYAKNFALPPWASGFLLHTNLHRVHHAFPYLPWRALPSAAPALAEPDTGFVSGVLMQLRGPIALDRVRGM